MTVTAAYAADSGGSAIPEGPPMHSVRCVRCGQAFVPAGPISSCPFCRTMNTAHPASQPAPRMAVSPHAGAETLTPQQVKGLVIVVAICLPIACLIFWFALRGSPKSESASVTSTTPTNHPPSESARPAASPSSPSTAETPDAGEQPTVSAAERVAAMEPPRLAPLASGVIVNLEVQEVEGRRPVVVGATNLPDGTAFIVSTQSRRGWRGQAKAKVHAGRFVAGPFGPEEGLTAGAYEAEATMPNAEMQADEVKAVIGAKGENLKGKLVHRDRTITTVESTIEFTVGVDSKAAAKLDRAALAEQRGTAVAIHDSLTELLGIGTGELSRLRHSESLDALARCGELMRDSQKRVAALRATAEELPSHYGALAAAAAQMELCVSCSELASGYCKRAKAALRDAKASLKTPPT
jgi:hypothetical protein